MEYKMRQVLVRTWKENSQTESLKERTNVIPSPKTSLIIQRDFPDNEIMISHSAVKNHCYHSLYSINYFKPQRHFTR